MYIPLAPDSAGPGPAKENAPANPEHMFNTSTRAILLGSGSSRRSLLVPLPFDRRIPTIGRPIEATRKSPLYEAERSHFHGSSPHLARSVRPSEQSYRIPKKVSLSSRCLLVKRRDEEL